jgi:hypothetical protein
VPVIDEARLAIPDGPALEREFYGGRGAFRQIVRKAYRETYRVADPLPLIRLLQQAMRPVWAVEYRTEAPEYRKLAAGLLSALAQANAPLVFHSPHEAHAGDNVIRLTWHSSGKRTQRWHYKVAHLPHMLHFDREGYSGWSELYGLDRSSVLAMEETLADSFHAERILPYLAEGRSKYRQDAKEPVEGRGFVFVPLQLPNDSVISLKLFPEPYLEGLRRMVERLAEAGLSVVLKRHPHCESPAVERFLATLPAGPVTVSRASIHALIPRSRCVLTLNSGVGFEALMHLKPVIVAGKADYRAAATELAEPEGVVAALEAAESAHDPRFVKRFLFLAMNLHQIDTREEISFQRAVLRALCHNYLELAPR